MRRTFLQRLFSIIANIRQSFFNFSFIFMNYVKQLRLCGGGKKVRSGKAISLKSISKYTQPIAIGLYILILLGLLPKELTLFPKHYLLYQVYSIIGISLSLTVWLHGKYTQ